MVAASVPSVYAVAVLELAGERGRSDELVAESRELAQSFRSAPELLSGLASPRIGRERAKGLLRSVLADKVCDELRDLLLLLVDRGRLDAALPVLDEIVAEAERRAGRVRVEAVSAVELDGSTRQRLEAALRRRLGEGVELACRIDPALRGGLTLRYGDVLVDGSVQRHLNNMQRRILASPMPAEVWDGELSISMKTGASE